jgi:hypothetical protein
MEEVDNLSKQNCSEQEKGRKTKELASMFVKATPACKFSKNSKN